MWENKTEKWEIEANEKRTERKKEKKNQRLEMRRRLTKDKKKKGSNLTPKQ